jgi:hypothetical protein
MRLEELFESKQWDRQDLVGYDEYLDSFSNENYESNSSEEWNQNGSTWRTYNANGAGITSMKGVARIINGKFRVGNNLLTSFEFAPEIVRGQVVISENKFKDLHNIHKYFKEIDWELYAEHMDLDGPMLGLLKIRKLRRVIIDDMEIGDIINKYLPEGDILECQEELINAGYEAQAKL